MTTSDIISLCNIGATVIAVLIAPIVALWIGGILQQRSNARSDKLRLLGVLLSLRHQPLSPENFRALNVIDAVFIDNANVRDAWTKYFAALNDPALNFGTGYSIREEKRRDLMMAIIESLGLKKRISTSDILRTYTPSAIVESEYLAIWERIKLREDLRAEFRQRGIGYPEFSEPVYPPPPRNPPPPGAPQTPPA